MYMHIQSVIYSICDQILTFEQSPRKSSLVAIDNGYLCMYI